MNTLYASPSRKILVVDDDSRLRELLRRYLTEQGFVVQVAENAREMTKIWYREHIDLLILDLTLPGEDGSLIASGYQGQQIYVLPTRDLVIVRLGITAAEKRATVREGMFEIAEMFSQG